MPKTRKRSLVLEVALQDRESFKVLPDKKQQKNIRDKIKNRLVRKGLEGEMLQRELVSEIRSELFKLQPEYKPKEPEPENNQSNFLNDKNFMVHGVDIWSEHRKIDPVQELENNYNRSVKEGFQQVFCPRCQSNPCRCNE